MTVNMQVRYITDDGKPTLEFARLFPEILTFADNTAAKAGGLTDGMIYKTATGELRIVV